MYMPPMPNSAEVLKIQISQAILQVEKETLDRIWEELEYDWDICSVKKGAHIEHI
jgi:hypothetical protein